jgi:hypothetical protein
LAYARTKSALDAVRVLPQLVLCLVLISVPARAAAAFHFGDEGWEGTSELFGIARAAAGADRVKITAVLDYDRLSADDALLILHPEVRLDRVQISRFLLAGGRLALLDDHGQGTAVLEHFQMRRIPAPLRPAMALRENSQLAVAVPAESHVAGSERGRHPVVASVDQLVTNHPTGVSHHGLTSVLVIPAQGEPDVALAVTGVIAQDGAKAFGDGGRLLVMGDPSAVMNLMLRYPGNRQFASGLIGYLLERNGRQGSGTLYLLSNDFSQKGAFGGQTGPKSWIERILNALRGLGGDWHRRGLPAWVTLALAVLLTVGVGAWTVSRLAQTYPRSLPRYATSLPLVAQAGAAGRAAVLSAPTTPRGLAALELKSAIVEGMASAVNMDPGATSEALLKELRARSTLQPASVAELGRLLADFRRLESKMVKSHHTRVSVTELKRWHEATLRLLSEMGQASRRSS